MTTTACHSERSECLCIPLGESQLEMFRFAQHDMEIICHSEKRSDECLCIPLGESQMEMFRYAQHDKEIKCHSEGILSVFMD